MGRGLSPSSLITRFWGGGVPPALDAIKSKKGGFVVIHNMR